MNTQSNSFAYFCCHRIKSMMVCDFQNAKIERCRTKSEGGEMCRFRFALVCVYSILYYSCLMHSTEVSIQQ